MDALSNIRWLYAMRFFHSLIPAYVIERLFWEQRGMTIPLVVYAEIIYAVTIVLLEVPTGILADRWGRKRMLIAAAVLSCFEFLILLYASEFWHFALVVFLAGIARTAASGSENALLYDSLLQHGREQLFEKHLGRMNALDFTAAILAALSGSWLAGRFGFELNYWISLGSAVLSLTISFFLKEPKALQAASSTEKPLPVRQYVAGSLRFFRTRPDVRLVVLTGMVTGAAVSFMDEFWQIYMNRLHIPVAFFGTVSAAMILLRVPGSVLAYALIGRFRYRPLILGVTSVIAVGFGCVALAGGYAGFAAVLLICLFSGIMEPLASGYLHHRIADSSMRATIDSFQSLGESLVLIVTGLGFGWLSARHDIFGGFGFIAALCGAFLMYAWFASRRIEP
jgi:MFS family permease